MKNDRICVLSSLLLLGVAGVVGAAGDPAPARLRRAESFLGIHFDFHAGPDCKSVGANTTPAMVESILDLVHPDYVQIDCKGHPGYTSYPTKVGNPAPGIVGDPLRLWRDVTARRGVGLYMHYSGVYDMHAVREPGWAAINADGKPNSRATSFFGPYAEKLLVPQLREIAGYGVDGAWVDGECWAAVPDYGEAALAAFREATGIRDVPRKVGEPHWFDFQQFHRDQFRGYLRKYISAVKRTNPGFQICSNWAFTDHMPERVSAPVDFLSGDYSPQDSVNSARMSARYLARQGVPWDLMAWSFGTKPKRAQKTAVQLEREAAVVLAMGGGFQAYFTQNRDGSVRLGEMPVMAEVAKFCRARQGTCHHSQPVAQVGLLLSTTDQYRRATGLFSRDLGRINGTLHALLEGRWSVEVVGEHQLEGRLAEYPLIVVPECEVLEPAFRDSLAAYVHGGGQLLLIGPAAARLFEREIGCKVEPSAGGPVHFSYAGGARDLTGGLATFGAVAGAKRFGELSAGENKQPAAVVVPHGRGRIAVTGFAFGQFYGREHPELLRRFLNDLVRELFPRPMVEVEGAGDVDVCVARAGAKLLVNLVNTSGPHATQSILESIPPVGPLKVRVRLDAEPGSVTLEPGARAVTSEYAQGELRLTVPKVEIHDIVVIGRK